MQFLQSTPVETDLPELRLLGLKLACHSPHSEYSDGRRTLVWPRWIRKAREEVLAELSEKTGTPLASVPQFREHCTATPTVMVKGRACATAERAQYAVFKSLSPAADGSLILAAKLAGALCV